VGCESRIRALGTHTRLFQRLQIETAAKVLFAVVSAVFLRRISTNPLSRQFCITLHFKEKKSSIDGKVFIKNRRYFHLPHVGGEVIFNVFEKMLFIGYQWTGEHCLSIVIQPNALSRDRLQCLIQVLLGKVPIHQFIQESRYEVGTTILVIQVVSMLPYVTSQ
jgi:hypothetical protein